MDARRCIITLVGLLQRHCWELAAFQSGFSRYHVSSCLHFGALTSDV